MQMSRNLAQKGHFMGHPTEYTSISITDYLAWGGGRGSTVPSNQKCDISDGFLRIKDKMIKTQLKRHRPVDMSQRKKYQKPI